MEQTCGGAAVLIGENGVYEELIDAFRRKSLHQYTAAYSHLVLIKRIKDLLPLPPDLDQISFAQNSQVMRNRGLSNPSFLNYVRDAKPLAAQQTHNLLSGVIGDGFGK